jgi:hypothetical protein
MEIFDVLKRNGNVRLDAEVTVECNPDSMSYKDLRLLRQEGVTRLSIGVQATDNDLLKLIGRRHNFQQAELAFSAARKAGDREGRPYKHILEIRLCRNHALASISISPSAPASAATVTSTPWPAATS